MIELPEALALAKQIKTALKGKKIASAIAAYSPHKFAWYHSDPKDYGALLRGKTIDNATSHGGQLEVWVGNARLLFTDGVVLRFHDKGEKRPKTHQLLLEFEDGTAVSASVQMYGGVVCFREGEYQNKYYDVACAKPSPLSDEFNAAYFDKLINAPDMQKLSAKALLATEQRVPGLGNGVLQDILYNAKIHPKQKIENLTGDEKKRLFRCVKSTLKEMTEQGGRDTSKDIFGQPGGYKTKLSAAAIGQPCPTCGGMVVKQAYMGGSIYFCSGCQTIN